jgi:hypothetical protein
VWYEISNAAKKVVWTADPLGGNVLRLRAGSAPTDMILGLTEGLDDLIDQDEADVRDVGVPAQGVAPDEISLSDTDQWDGRGRQDGRGHWREYIRSEGSRGV